MKGHFVLSSALVFGLALFALFIVAFASFHFDGAGSKTIAGILAILGAIGLYRVMAPTSKSGDSREG